MTDFVKRELGPLRLEVHNDQLVLAVYGSADDLAARLALDELACVAAELEAKEIPHEVCLQDAPGGNGKEPDKLVFKLKGER